MSRSRQTRSRIATTASWLALSLLAVALVPSGSARAPSVAKGGGTLRVAIYVDPGTIEPATTGGDQATQLMYATQLTLVTYSERGPGTGRRIIPYGGQMPTLSNDGRRYTFRIRPGLRFSDGSPVTAHNFQAGFERVLDPRIGGLWGWQYENVVGALDFMQGRAANVSGVKAPTKDRLVFQLAEAEPDFLSRLALLQLVSAMPLDLPRVPNGVDAPLPSAGPYYVQEYVTGRTLRLVRNPYWKPSTLPSRPANVKEIDYVERATAGAAVAAVRKGDADIATVLDPTDLNPDLIRELARRYRNRGQFWVRPRTRRYNLVFNTRHPPFDRARFRRAVSFALDRTQLLDALGPLAGHVTDQLLPPVSAGFRDWKLYPPRPDLPRATRLARGELQGRNAILIVSSTGSGPDIGSVIKANLAPLGLDIEVVPIAPSIFRDYLRTNNRWDLATLLTNPGRVDPMVFINFGLEGHSYDFVPGACPCFYNYSGFDDPKWVKRMRRTNSLRHGRLKAYAWLDRDLMRKAAPVAPYATGNSLTLVSPRIGCFRKSAYPAYLAPNLAALCLR